MLKGITVMLMEYSEEWKWDPFDFENDLVQDYETDPFMMPVAVLQPEQVDDVLVCPENNGDIPQTDALMMARERYTLAIPKSDTHVWTNGIVDFWGKRWRVVGPVTQGIEDLIPLRWNKKVTVERFGS